MREWLGGYGYKAHHIDIICRVGGWAGKSEYIASITEVIYIGHFKHIGAIYGVGGRKLEVSR